MARIFLIGVRFGDIASIFMGGFKTQQVSQGQVHLFLMGSNVHHERGLQTQNI